MFKLTAILKALGINVSQEDIEKLEVLIPQIPAKAQELVKAVALALEVAEKRIAALEAQQAQTLEVITRNSALQLEALAKLSIVITTATEAKHVTTRKPTKNTH